MLKIMERFLTFYSKDFTCNEVLFVVDGNKVVSIAIYYWN